MTPAFTVGTGSHPYFAARSTLIIHVIPAPIIARVFKILGMTALSAPLRGTVARYGDCRSAGEALRYLFEFREQRLRHVGLERFEELFLTLDLSSPFVRFHREQFA